MEQFGTRMINENTMRADELPRHVEELNLKLDDLWERYLNLLNEYQAARTELSKELSSGYMSLAQANFTSTSRQRYGRDYYDERMQATRTVIVEQSEDDVERIIISKPAPVEEFKEKAEEDKDEPSEAPNEEDKMEEKAETKPVDPMRWFGILVPPALRSAQVNFISAVEGPLPRVANLTKELRAMEIEIGRAKKAIRKLDKV